jgi:Txe/YoeB family toxin of Txe-Axe toxin-antitoxin module
MSEANVTPTVDAAAVTPDAVDAPETAKDSTPEAPKAPTKRKIKANGREVEIDEAEIDRYLSMGVSANEKWQEAAKLRREAETLQKQIEEDPFKYLQSKNPKLREKAEEWLLERIQEDEMSPEQRELKKYKEKEAAEKEDADRKAKEAEESQAKEAEQHYIQQFDKELSSACAKHSVPRTSDFIKRVALKMSDAIDNDVDLSAEDAVAMVKDDYVSDVKHFLSQVEDILPFLGEEIAGKLRKSDLERVKKPNTVSIKSTPKQEPTQKFRTIEEMQAAAAKALESL